MEYSNLITEGFKSIYFKLVFTSYSRQYLINPQWTITQFIEIMRPVVCRDFNLENCEFVDTVQQCIPSENGVALTYQNNVTLTSKYGDDLNVAFYIRQVSAPVESSQVDDTQLRCVICLTRQRNMLYMPCRHICCCSDCDTHHTIHVCPICRIPISERLAIYLY